ncbi:hypothetical protein LCGC14_2666710 [marine sediment metagenome]|uniref:10 kDa chaperonin n=1 Tax=marine sediment metagenome TaxID=412755 RepID=A0A0F8ZQE8_9ZZZZ
MHIEPLENRVVIKLLEEKVRPGGIIIPTEAKEKSMEGIVMTVGPDVRRLKEGDTVLYSKFVGTEVIYQGEDFLIMKESEVLAILGSE